MSTAQIVYRRTADVIYIMAAMGCAYLVYPMVFPAQNHAADLSVEQVQFTAASAAAPIPVADPAANYRLHRENLANALSDAGVTLAETMSLRATDDYYSLLDMAGPDFLRAQIESAKLGVLHYREKEAGGQQMTAVDLATVKMEQAKIGYYTHLLTTR